ERQARIDSDRAQEIARAAREEAKRARAEARDVAGGERATPRQTGDTAELDALTERIIEVEARAEHLAEENERLRRALGQVREAMGADGETEEAELEELEPGAPGTVLEAVEQARERVQHLVLLDDAFESAADSPYRRPQ